MKYFLVLALLLSSTLSRSQDNSKIYKASEITFLGLDYSSALFIGSTSFKSPVNVAVLTDSWNRLFIFEDLKYNIEKALGIKTTLDLSVVTQRNKQTDFTSNLTDEILILPHLHKANLDSIIADYPDFDKPGTALVFIVDAYDKAEAKGYYHIVFFDKTTKKILLTYTLVGKAGGMGLRNYWARSFHEVILQMGKRFRASAEFYHFYTR